MVEAKCVDPKMKRKKKAKKVNEIQNKKTKRARILLLAIELVYLERVTMIFDKQF